MRRPQPRKDTPIIRRLLASSFLTGSPTGWVPAGSGLARPFGRKREAPISIATFRQAFSSRLWNGASELCQYAVDGNTGGAGNAQERSRLRVPSGTIVRISPDAVLARPRAMWTDCGELRVGGSRSDAEGKETMAYDAEVAVVTGSANGIGRACALRLAKNGFSVFLLDRDGENLRDAVREIEQAGGKASYAVVDLTDRKAVEATFAEIARSRGVIGVLVNNVGQSARERASEFWCSEPDLWDFMIDISLKTTLICSRQVVPSMRERKSGRIINIASEAALIGSKRATAYTAAKAGVLGFTRSLARELASFQVTVNAVAPGYTRTRALAMLP